MNSEGMCPYSLESICLACLCTRLLCLEPFGGAASAGDGRVGVASLLVGPVIP